jgi:hypothetical protein
MSPEWYHADGTACGHGGPLAADPLTCRGGEPVGWVQLAFPDTEPAEAGT